VSKIEDELWNRYNNWLHCWTMREPPPEIAAAVLAVGEAICEWLDKQVNIEAALAKVHAVGEEIQSMRKRFDSKTVIGPDEPPATALTFTAPTQPKCPFWAHCDGERIIIRNAVACVPLKEYETLKAQQPPAPTASDDEKETHE